MHVHVPIHIHVPVHITCLPTPTPRTPPCPPALPPQTADISCAMFGMDAAIVLLHLLSAPAMATQLYTDEVIDVVVESVKWNLQVNVMAFHEPRFMKQWRHSSMEQGRHGLALTCRHAPTACVCVCVFECHLCHHHQQQQPC